MRARGIKERFLRDESGFTLTELMVVLVVMVIVLIALNNVFSVGTQALNFGNNEVEAVENARLGLEKMEREIRGAYRYDSSTIPTQNHLFFDTATPAVPMALPAGTPKTVNQITFGNDLGTEGNRKVECGAPCEYITYKQVDDTLRRVNTANSGDPGEPVVENVIPGGLTFTFYKADGTTPANEGEIGKVLVSLEVAVDPGNNTEGHQLLTTEIDLRNRQ